VTKKIDVPCASSPIRRAQCRLFEKRTTLVVDAWCFEISWQDCIIFVPRAHSRPVYTFFIMLEAFTLRVDSAGRVMCQEHVGQQEKEQHRSDTQKQEGFCVYMAEAASCCPREDEKEGEGEALRRGLVTYNVRSCLCVVLWASDVRALALAHFTSTSTDSVRRSAEKLLLPLLRPFSSTQMLYVCLGHGYKVGPFRMPCLHKHESFTRAAVHECPQPTAHASNASIMQFNTSAAHGLLCTSVHMQATQASCIRELLFMYCRACRNPNCRLPARKASWTSSGSAFPTSASRSVPRSSDTRVLRHTPGSPGLSWTPPIHPS